MTPSILIVEDDALFAEQLATSVRSLGHEVSGIAQDAHQALALVETLPKVHLALLDIGLPGERDGIALSAILRERFGIPFIFISEHSDEATLRRIKASKPRGYLCKPLDQQALWTTLEVALRAHEDCLRQVAAERHRVRSEALYEAILEQSHDAVVSVDGDQKITVFNRGAVHTFGYEPEEVLGKSISMLVPEEHLPAHLEYVQRFRDESQPSREMGRPRAVTGKRKDGRIFPAEITISRVSVGDEMVLTAIVRDVTQRRMLEARLAQADRMDAMGRLAGGIAHDFNNLLTGILGYTRLLQSSFDVEDPRREDMTEIRIAGERASRLVKELLAYGRRQSMERKRIDLNALVRDSEKMIVALLDRKAHLELHLENKLPLLLADPNRIEQVLISLVLNARDAMPAGGTLTISTGFASSRDVRDLAPAPHGYVVISVRDTGIGMDDEVLSRIFEPYFTTKGEEGATGLGLASAYGTVHQSSGDIRVQSAPGVGTEFRVILPAEGSKVFPAVTERVGDSEPARTLLTILLADDEPLVRDLAARVLRDHGYRVVTAADGQEAWSRIEEHQGAFDLLLSDVVMPGISGLELVERYHGLYPHAPIMVMTAYAEDLSRDRNRTVPFRLLEKPFSPDQLIRIVDELMSAELEDTGERAQ